MHSKLAAFLLPVLAAATPVPQAKGIDPSLITIVSTSYSGNGCPQGTVSTDSSSDKTVITYGFDQFQTYIGPTISKKDNSRQCQLHLNLRYPGGFQYAIVEATYHGFARLDAGVRGEFLTSYYFSQDASKTSTTKMVATGGGALLTGQVYTKSDTVETASTIWSPCGSEGLLNINNRISLTSTDPKASGELSNDDATVAFTHQLHVSWRPCTPGKGGDSGNGGVVIVPNTPSAEVDFQ